MFEFIFEAIVEFLVLTIFSIPGGLIRWIIFRRKPLKEYITDDFYINSFPVIVLVAIIILIINLV